MSRINLSLSDLQSRARRASLSATRNHDKAAAFRWIGDFEAATDRTERALEWDALAHSYKAEATTSRKGGRRP